MAISKRLEKLLPAGALSNIKVWSEESHRAAAASGKGPQPWEREWYTNYCDYSDLLDAKDVGWYLLQRLDFILSWALSSPQGKEAVASAGDAWSPSSETYGELMEIRKEIQLRRQRMLSDDDLLSAPNPNHYDAQHATNQCDYIDLIRTEVFGWHLLNIWLEITDWALASPQGQEALALDGEAEPPLQTVLDELLRIRFALLSSRTQLLIEHGGSLGMDEELIRSALWGGCSSGGDTEEETC